MYVYLCKTREEALAAGKYVDDFLVECEEDFESTSYEDHAKEIDEESIKRTPKLIGIEEKEYGHRSVVIDNKEINFSVFYTDMNENFKTLETEPGSDLISLDNSELYEILGMDHE